MRLSKEAGSVVLLITSALACGDSGSGPSGPASPPVPAETIVVDASASPTSGPAQLRAVTLIADVSVGGQANTGSFTYTFDCDVSDETVDDTAKTDSTSVNSDPVCHYPDVGAYTYEICVTRAGTTGCGTGTVTATEPAPPGQRSLTDRPDDPAQVGEPMLRLYYVCPKDPGRCRNLDTDGTIQGWVEAGQEWFRRHAGREVIIDEAGGRYDITFVQLDMFDSDVVDLAGPSRMLSTLGTLLDERGFSYEDKASYMFYEGGATTHCGFGSSLFRNNQLTGWAVSFLRRFDGPVTCDSESRAVSRAEPLVFPSWVFIHETGHVADLGHTATNHRDFMYVCEDGTGCDGRPDRRMPLFDPDDIYSSIFHAWRYLSPAQP